MRPPACTSRVAAICVLAVSLAASAPNMLSAGQGQAAANAATGIWAGVFTTEQAERGRRSYEEHCAGCHGLSLDGGRYRALTGDRFWASWQDTTLDRLLGQITATMPFSGDGSRRGTLGAGVYADIVSHILNTNGFPSGARELSAESIAGVRIARKGGSGELPAGSFIHVVGCLARGETPKQWKLVMASAPVRVITGDSIDAAAPLGSREYALLFVITSLDRFAGHRMSVRGSLVGDGGAEGVNVTTVTSTSEVCQ
jgi:hypothetical protein